MTCLPSKALRLLLSLTVLLPAVVSSAASLSMVINPSHPSISDAAYPGTGSTVTSATDSSTGLKFSIAGRNYGVNPAPGQMRWGLRGGPSPLNSSPNTFLVTNGFTPAAAGSKKDQHGNDASYISITVSNVLPNTLFQNLSIDFSGLNFTRTTNAWAAASVSGFSTWTAANQTNNGPNGRKLSVTLQDFSWSGGDPLEIRLYGITGADEGTFATVKLTATVLMAPQVPEPSAFALGLVTVAWFTRRRRKSGLAA